MCGKVLCNQPTIHDPNLKVEMIYQGDVKYGPDNVSPVSSMTILGPHDILLLNKNDGTVHRILNNTLLKNPLLDVNVANKRERGLLGIDTSKDSNGKIYVYLYYTESEKSDGSDVCPTKRYSNEYHCMPDNEPIGNRLYKYELKNNKLVNPKLLLDLPAAPAPSHNGGVVTIGPDNNLYVTIGDLLGGTNTNSSTRAQNLDERNPDGRGGILRITQDGKPVGEGILGKSMPLQLYYAYGIRNSFGIDFDPIAGNLWDTENGPEYGDEINLVKPGFNSGWERIQGTHVRSNGKLENFDGRGKYSSPEFIWEVSSGVTAAKFLDSDKLGKKYENDLFVASFNSRTIYHFDLNKDRTGLSLKGSISDKIANNSTNLDDIIFVQEIGMITDIDIGPDGFMYVLSAYMGKPTIFRIVPIQNLGPLKAIMNLPTDRIDLIDKNHIWKPSKQAEITQSADNLTIRVNTSEKKVSNNRGFLVTELNLRKPLLLSLNYKIGTNLGNATYRIEIRDSNSSKVLFKSGLENIPGNAIEKKFILPPAITPGELLEFRVYVVTKGGGYHAIVINKFDILQT